MKHTFKMAVIAVLAICLLTSFAACGTDNGENTSSPELQTTADTTPDEPQDGTTAPTTTAPATSETTEPPYTGPVMNDGAAESNDEFGDLVEG